MKLLFISNLYPPYHISGYEMLCHEAATQLEARGHEVSVLTSTYGVQAAPAPVPSEPGIYRRLELDSDRYYYRPGEVARYWRNKRINLAAVERIIGDVAADAVVIWGMWNMSRRVAMRAEALAGSKVVYYLADVWPSEPTAHEGYWDGPERSVRGRIFKRVLRIPVRLLLRPEWRPYRLRFEHVIASCRSTRDELLNAGLPIEHCQVIYEGIDPAPYSAAAERRAACPDKGLLRVVFVGSLVEHKGAHTAIEAVGHLVKNKPQSAVHLTVLGAGHPQYEARLHQVVEEWRLDGRVSFQRPIPRAELPAFLAGFDVLVMPSVYKEPLARISQEAMAAGMVLVATLTGGTHEILVDGENGLAFGPEDAPGLAAQLHRLAHDADLRRRLARAGQETVAGRFTIVHMIDGLEAYLKEVASH